MENLQRLLQLLKHHGKNINATLIQRTIERKLPKTTLLQLEQCKLQNPTWNVESLVQQLFLLLTQNENIHRALNISVQQQAKNIQHTIATRNRTSAISATASPAPKSTERPKTHNIQKSEQKPQKRQPTTPCIFCSGMHWTTQCHKYFTPQQRHELAKSKKLCFKCSKIGHEIYDCPRKFSCYYCKGNYHSTLCLTPKRSHLPTVKRQTATPAVVKQFEPSDQPTGESLHFSSYKSSFFKPPHYSKCAVITVLTHYNFQSTRTDLAYTSFSLF